MSFNPRICKRCDSRLKRQTVSLSCFNPRICKRCDRDAAVFKLQQDQFQSTHL